MEPSGDEKKEWSEREAEKGHVVEHHLSESDETRLQGRGREEKKLAQISRGEWKPWLSGDQAPVQLCAALRCAGQGSVHGGHRHPIRSVVQASLPPSLPRAAACLAFSPAQGGPGRNQQQSSILEEEEEE